MGKFILQDITGEEFLLIVYDAQKDDSLTTIQSRGGFYSRMLYNLPREHGES